MGNHRAEPRPRRSSGAARSAVTVQSPTPRAPKRAASRAARPVAATAAATTPAPVEAPVLRAPVVETPVVKTRVAETPAAVAAGKPTGGRRRAATPAKKPFFARIPAVPTLVGITALAIAGTGAVTLGEGAPSSSAISLSAGSVNLQGTDAIGFVGSPRALALSRDSERQALQDAAQAQLLAAAEQQAAERNAELKSLGRAAEARASEIAENRWVMPLSGYRLTARFGMAGGLWSSGHTGLDLAAPSGTPLLAMANGTVTETGWAGSYGNRTIITLEDGTELWYCHQNSIGVSVGDTVTGGEQIGEVGSTGNSTGPHLHLEVRPGGGDPVDPYAAMVFHGLTP